ncbi:hypothetical protein DBR06_SOUSAS26510017, partial [Sousa chinensis]
QDSRKVSFFSFPSLVFAINSHENVSQNRLSSVCPRTSSLWVNLAEITEGRIMKTLFRCEFVIKDRPTGWRSNDAKFTPACPCVKCNYTSRSKNVSFNLSKRDSSGKSQALLV